jgi:hypothetical protein
MQISDLLQKINQAIDEANQILYNKKIEKEKQIALDRSLAESRYKKATDNILAKLPNLENIGHGYKYI